MEPIIYHQSIIPHQKTLIVICGPTAVGKTAVAIEVAKHFKTEILSADSRQFYREMNIGTAKPGKDELATVPHHFINTLSIHDTYTAGQYEREALKILDKIFESRDIAVMVGGSGLFIRAVCEGFDDFKKESGDSNQDIIGNIKRMPLSDMQAEIARLDPQYYEKVDRNNPRRLQRALEVIYTTGKKYSDQRMGEKAERPFNIIKIGLNLPKEQLYERINHRVDEMMASGQWEEATALYPFKHLQPLQTVGYQEIFDSIDGKLTKEEAIAKIKQNTRHYAKRQLTWFKKDKEVRWYVWEHRYISQGQEFLYSNEMALNLIIKTLDYGLTKNEDGIINFFVPPKYKAHPWDDIESRYIDLIEKKWKLEKMLELVRYIKSSGLSERLYGLTSLWSLRISPNEYIGFTNTLNIIIEGPNMLLAVADKKDDQRFKCTFSYKPESLVEEKQIIYDLDQIVETFKNFINKIGWVD